MKAAAWDSPPSVTCVFCFEPPEPGRDLCAEHAAREQAALAACLHADLEKTGPGFFERETLAFEVARPTISTVPILAPASIGPGEDATAYGRAAIAGLHGDIQAALSAGSGRNMCLFTIATRLARLARDGHADRAYARELADRIAEELTPDELPKARDTVRRAFKIGGAS